MEAHILFLLVWHLLKARQTMHSIVKTHETFLGINQMTRDYHLQLIKSLLIMI